MALHIVILAAGQGKRMFSERPKVLHALGGKPMLAHVIETAQTLSPKGIHVIIGHQGDQIKTALAAYPVQWIRQEEQLGTGHAVLQALPHIPNDGQILVLSADVPLIEATTLRQLISQCQTAENTNALGLLVASVPNPTGLGRIIRNSNHQIHAIIEEKDATDSQKQIQEIYSGICCAPTQMLQKWLPQIGNQNAQKEYYLTQIVSLAVADNYPITSVSTANLYEISGVNNRAQLQILERYWQSEQAQALMLQGVTLADAHRIDIRGELKCEKDVFIDVNTVFSGQVVIGEGSTIGPNCVLNNVIIGKNCQLLAHSVLDACQIGDDCQIGPFARVRPGTRLANACKIGNFVETKNASFDQGSKANHLSYLGDVTIGRDVNIGAGTITCNYDGAHKHQTIIEDGAFIGSDTQLVAPVTVGKNATIGAGSTIRQDAPADALTLNGTKQRTIYGWERPKKNE